MTELFSAHTSLCTISVLFFFFFFFSCFLSLLRHDSSELVNASTSRPFVTHRLVPDEALGIFRKSGAIISSHCWTAVSIYTRPFYDTKPTRRNAITRSLDQDAARHGERLIFVFTATAIVRAPVRRPILMPRQMPKSTSPMISHILVVDPRNRSCQTLNKPLWEAERGFLA